ncbi:MOSC domain-containing protein [Geodermatophilus chilensis]|uniref:MOSC domain-containing protein n=1 Tax=Geodermatophilus chilensis TaxID=2035835 RepID=UPI0018E450EA|nr:MOSC N-terminal beta barrel domain-containing protein [Geodermatophilus chilensis]
MPVALRVARLSTTPVKGLALHHPHSIELTEHGAVGDRVFYLVDDTGRVQSLTANAELCALAAVYDDEDHRLEVTRGGEVVCAGVVDTAGPVDTDMWGLRTITSDLVAGSQWSTFFSDVLGKPVRLVRARGAAYDVRPATLLGTSSVDELGRRAGLPGVDPRRFRMLIEFSGGEPHVEDSWAGVLLQVGSVVLRGGGPVKRCAATTRNPGSGAVDLQTLRLITSYRGRHDTVLGVGATFGIYCDVLEPGPISVGDGLLVDATGEHRDLLR